MGTQDDSSAQQWTALDDAPCGLALTSDQGVFIRANTTFCSWLGYAAGELVGKRRVQDLLTMGGKIFHQTHWIPLLQMQGSISEVRLEVMHKDGHAIPMILNAIRHERNGVVVHDLAAFISRDRDKFEQELLASGRKLKLLVDEANHLKEEAKDRALFAEQMVGIVSHDLRNPLSTVLMGATVLGQGELSAHQHRIVSRILRATDRANRLITDLLDFTQARLGTGLSVSPRQIDLHAEISETIDELASAYPTRELRHVQEGSCPCRGDADRVSQMLGNLVSNAMTYGDPSKAVTVTSVALENACVISVHNFGKPISAAMQATLFRPMVRGQHDANVGRSVGLGLFIVSEIAKAHSGTVEVSSDDEHGTTFTARL